MDKWDRRFIEIAKQVATWSTCLRRHVGAVLVKDKHIIATGYNGSPRGITDCKTYGKCRREGVESGQHLELCSAVHAEQNCIIQCARYGISTEGATLYCTHLPCSECMKILINAGIETIYYIEEYPSSLTYSLAKETEIELIQLEV